MECDSMHAAIERCLKYRDINVPADYIHICKTARQKRPPYSVNYINHTFFKDFSKNMIYRSIRPGLKKGDPKVTDIRSLKYTEDGLISYKLIFSEDFRPLPVRTNNRQLEDFPNLHQKRLKITETKFRHLQELKSTLVQISIHFMICYLMINFKKTLFFNTFLLKINLHINNVLVIYIFLLKTSNWTT